MKMKISDYIASFLASKGVTHAFGMSGGAAVHMFDSIQKHPQMSIISMTHEQCAAIAADGYARASGKLGVAVTTSGPGATNLLTGTCCSYYDSVPVLMLTGQVATHRLKGERKVRQVGFQETDVVSIFSAVTKYAHQVTDPTTIRYHLEKAYHTAFEGRPGPVLLDIPDDLQRIEVDPGKLEAFCDDSNTSRQAKLELEVSGLLDLIAQAERPVLVLGGGLKTPPVGTILDACIEKLNIPVLCSWAALDLIPASNPLRVGTFGVYGPRVGNYVVQNADLVIALGTRLSQNLTGGVLSSFARGARIVMVDADEHELSKFEGRGINIHQGIHSRLDDFLRVLDTTATPSSLPSWSKWKERIAHWRSVFPHEQSGPLPKEGEVDAYNFVAHLCERLTENELTYIDTGGNLTWSCNGFKPKQGQRVHSAWNNTPMGYSLPAAIGAAFYDPSKGINCIIGDGGLMVCLAELATVTAHNLPIRIFLFNNHGHGIQKQTLETWLNGRYVCVDPGSGLAFPTDFCAVAKALGLKVHTISNETNLADDLDKVFSTDGPVFVNVEINPSQKLYPVLKHGAALENQMPKLDPQVIQTEMIIAPFELDASSTEVKKQSSEGW